MKSMTSIALALATALAVPSALAQGDTAKPPKSKCVPPVGLDCPSANKKQPTAAAKETDKDKAAMEAPVEPEATPEPAAEPTPPPTAMGGGPTEQEPPPPAPMATTMTQTTTTVDQPATAPAETDSGRHVRRGFGINAFGSAGARDEARWGAGGRLEWVMPFGLALGGSYTVNWESEGDRTSVRPLLGEIGWSFAVVERELVGGECPYWGCVPSKTLLRSGETLKEAERARHLAASRVEWTVDFPKVSKRVLWMARDLDDTRPAAAIEANGAKLFRGDGKLRDLHTVDVGGEQLVARKAVVIANGGTAVIPHVPGLDTVEFWTNRQAAIPTELPATLAILGGGAVGIELGQAFARLGCKVTVIEAGATFLRLEEPEAGAALRPHLEADGMRFVIGDSCLGVERQGSGVVIRLKSGTVVEAERLLVATGRRPNAEAWQQTGLAQTERGWLKVDPSTLEAQPGVFGAGDITGLGGFTHLAHYHGQVIARRLRGIDARADHTAVPRVTYTDPEVASVGLSEAAARKRGTDVVVATADPGETARGAIHDFHGGVLKLVGDRERGVLIGATLVTPRAGEILGELVLAIKLGTPLQTLADVIHPFPAFNRVLGESLDRLAARITTRRP